MRLQRSQKGHTPIVLEADSLGGGVGGNNHKLNVLEKPVQQNEGTGETEDQE